MSQNLRDRSSKSPFYKRPWFWAALVVLVLLVIGSIVGNAGSKKTSGTSTPSTTSESSTTNEPTTEDNPAAPGAATVQGPIVPPGSGASAGPSACRTGDPLANVYHPNRLGVAQSCTTVAGTVKSVHHEDDGDFHFDLALDPPYTNLLTAANLAHQHGWLVVEIVPADESGCTPGQPPRPPTGTYNYGICTGADESPPALGSHVYVTGPYVTDEDHGGWAEVHPAWAISSTASGSGPATTPPPTAAPAPSQAPPSTAPPSAPGDVGVVHPGAFCSPEGARGHTSDGTPMVCGPASDGRNRWHHA